MYIYATYRSGELSVCCEVRHIVVRALIGACGTVARLERGLHVGRVPNGAEADGAHEVLVGSHSVTTATAYMEINVRIYGYKFRKLFFLFYA